MVPGSVFLIVLVLVLSEAVLERDCAVRIASTSKSTGTGTDTSTGTDTGTDTSTSTSTSKSTRSQ